MLFCVWFNYYNSILFREHQDIWHTLMWWPFLFGLLTDFTISRVLSNHAPPTGVFTISVCINLFILSSLTSVNGCIALCCLNWFCLWQEVTSYRWVLIYYGMSKLQILWRCDPSTNDIKCGFSMRISNKSNLRHGEFPRRF